MEEKPLRLYNNQWFVMRIPVSNNFVHERYQLRYGTLPRRLKHKLTNHFLIQNACDIPSDLIKARIKRKSIHPLPIYREDTAYYYLFPNVGHVIKKQAGQWYYCFEYKINPRKHHPVEVITLIEHKDLELTLRAILNERNYHLFDSNWLAKLVMPFLTFTNTLEKLNSFLKKNPEKVN